MPVTAFQVDIVKAIREAFDHLRFQFDGTFRVWTPWQEEPLEEGKTGWTQAINTTLCMIGREHFGMVVGASKVVEGTHLDHGEWLYDVTWCDHDEDERMDGLPLVAECEWTNTIGHILEDFQKLLVARAGVHAGVRLMIHEHFTNHGQPPGRFPGDTFPGNNDDRAAWMAGHLAGHIRAFGCTQRDDVYLLAALQWDRDTAAEYRFRYFFLNTDGTATEWVEKKPCPLVANAPWVVFPEDLLPDTQNDLAQEEKSVNERIREMIENIREAFDQLRFRFTASEGRTVRVPWQKNPLQGATGFTTAIKIALCQAGHQSCCTVACNGANGAADHHSEFLWDVTWWKKDKEGRVDLQRRTGERWSIDMPLAAECEIAGMTVAHIAEDFQKLLVARTDLRLMIHEHFFERGEQMGEGYDRAQNLATCLAQYVQVFCHTQPDDVYMLVALDGNVPEGEEYEYHRIRYFRLGVDGVAVEWNKGEPSPFVVNEP